MNAKHATFGILLTTVVAITGCDRQPKAGSGGGKPPPNYNQMMEQGQTAARDAAAKAAAAAAARAGDPQVKISPATTQLVDDVKARGNDLLAKLDGAIKAHKLDDAQTYADAFDKIKDTVPAEAKASYESLKAQLTAAKANATTPAPSPAPAPVPTTPAEPNK